jgi:DNA-binding GntR family transcriptional regulator
VDNNTLAQVERADLLVESVLQKITEAIVTNRLRPGEKLVETRLGEQLGVSRGPVREAFRRLEQMGLVEKIPYRGAFVSALTQQDAEELHNVREPLEGLATRLLAERRDPHAIAKLESILTEMSQGDISSDQSRMIELDVDFHNALIELTEHKLLHEIWQIVSVRLRRFLYLKRQRLYRTPVEAVQIHKPIVRAIAAGEAEQAELEARRHVMKARQNINFEDTLVPETLEAEVL